MTRVPPSRLDDTDLTCANGEPWMGPHPICETKVVEACEQFAAAVARGEYNARGFTPSEWRRYLGAHPGEREARQ